LTQLLPAHLKLAASDLIEENIDIIGVGKNPITMFDDPLDLSQPVPFCRMVSCTCSSLAPPRTAVSIEQGFC
jgi:hypothetical protein